MTGGDLLAEAVEELYSADPEGFTERRAELVAQARSAGQAAVARQIAALRKPTRSAWVINQLARSDPEAVSRLADLGDELRAAERARDGGALRELSQARRRLIAELVRQALAAAGQQAAPAALREDVTATLAAALADPEVAGQIGHGTLLRPARRAGFGTEQGPVLALVPPSAPARPGVAEVERERAGREEHERASREKPDRVERAERARGRQTRGAQARTPREERERAAREQRERAEQERAAEEERERAAREEEERERAEAERERREAKAEAERALADADQAVEAARAVEQDLADTLRGLEQQVADLRHRLLDTRTELRQAQIAQRKARQALGRLPQ